MAWTLAEEDIETCSPAQTCHLYVIPYHNEKNGLFSIFALIKNKQIIFLSHFFKGFKGSPLSICYFYMEVTLLYHKRERKYTHTLYKNKLEYSLRLMNITMLSM